MNKIKKIEDLKVWQESCSFVIDIYEITKRNKISKDFGLKDQIRRAAISVPSNIAEGFERKTDKEFSKFLYIAKGSAGEVRTQLFIGLKLGYIDSETYNLMKKKIVKISKRLSKFISYLNKK